MQTTHHSIKYNIVIKKEKVERNYKKIVNFFALGNIENIYTKKKMIASSYCRTRDTPLDKCNNRVKK